MNPQFSAKQIILGNRILTTQNDGLYLDGVRISLQDLTQLLDSQTPTRKISIDFDNRTLHGIDGATEKLKWDDSSPDGQGVYMPNSAPFGI